MLQAFKVTLFCPEKWSSNCVAKMSKMSKCRMISSIPSMAALFQVFQLSPGSLKLSESLDIIYPLEQQELTECH